MKSYDKNWCLLSFGIFEIVGIKGNSSWRGDYAFSNGIGSGLCAVHYVNKIRDLTFYRWAELNVFEILSNFLLISAMRRMGGKVNLYKGRMSNDNEFSVLYFLCLRIKILTSLWFSIQKLTFIVAHLSLLSHLPDVWFTISSNFPGSYLPAFISDGKHNVCTRNNSHFTHEKCRENWTSWDDVALSALRWKTCKVC